ncbi:thioredoxin [Penicillium waksmanii]|uniref:thioredoxin n=1 Tax=Penicillium waksmanii TaxID=69791 RepID=UPI0025481F57|nr:thioredoxin [Penicillium waksmanii]KAJ5984354.1 thioredoxin [Penicillium waksmanii]
MTNFKIQIISDSVCPWCYVGFKRLSRAITSHKTQHPTDTFTIAWKAFYLNPSSPTYPGKNKQEMYKAKFGAERVTAMFARLASVGESEGIHFSFGGNTGSTRDSHRLIWFAGELEKKQQQEATSSGEAGAIGGIQTRVVEKLFRAYFEEEKNITDKAVLSEAGISAGLDGGAVRALLEDKDEADEGGEEVDAEAAAASRQLVSGVPFFEIQGKYAIEGADEPETFLEIFQRVKDDE